MRRLIPALFALHLTAQPPVPVDRSYLITARSIGPVRMGMTMAALRKALPKARMSEASDGEGPDWICIERGKRDSIFIQMAGSRVSPGPRTDKVYMIQTFSPKYRTRDGVHVGMRLRDVELRWGKLVKYEHSSIEDRSFAFFPRMPKGWLVQFENGPTPTSARKDLSRPLPDDVISSIWIER